MPFVPAIRTPKRYSLHLDLQDDRDRLQRSIQSQPRPFVFVLGALDSLEADRLIPVDEEDRYVRVPDAVIIPSGNETLRFFRLIRRRLSGRTNGEHGAFRRLSRVVPLEERHRPIFRLGDIDPVNFPPPIQRADDVRRGFRE